MRLTAQGVFRQLFIFSDTGGGGEQRIGRGVQRGFAGVLQNADDEAHGDHLHGDIVRDTKHITGQRDQQQRPARHAGSAAGAQRGDHAQQQRGWQIDRNIQRVYCRQGQNRDGNRRAVPC